jgi:hypothetical protein
MVRLLAELAYSLPSYMKNVLVMGSNMCYSMIAVQTKQMIIYGN